MSDKLQSEFSQDLKDRAHYLRYSVIEGLETHLLALESKLLDHKLNVRWAQDEESLCNNIIDLLPHPQYNRVCFDMSNVPTAFKQNTDNVMNLVSVESLANHDNEADVLVVDADFAVVENGSLVFINKPSKDCFNLVGSLIVVVNIDQLIVSSSDLSLFLKMKSNNGEDFPKDVKILNQAFEKLIVDTFQSSNERGYSTENVEISVILYENNVSGILEDYSLRQSLYCINCGRCYDVCPVAKLSSHLSPIEVVKNNCFDQFNHTQSIFQHTTLCGNCAEVCPVGVPLIDMLIYEMNLVNGNVNYSKSKKMYSIISKRSKLNKFNGPFLRYFFVKKFFGKNKILQNYFLNQKDSFYNVTRNTPDKEDDQFEL